MKCCSICKEIKPFEFFGKDRYKKDGLTPCCKACSKLVREGYRVPKKSPKTEKTCKACSTLKPILEFYRYSNKCKICQANERFQKAALKPPKSRVYSSNVKSVYKRKRREQDPLFKLRSNIGSRIANLLAERGYKKTSNTDSILGCSFLEFKTYLESLFVEGMSWNNRELWHIDHIIPVSFAINEQELLWLNHYTNLRPVWKEENLSKSAAIIDIAIEHPLYKKIIESRN